MVEARLKAGLWVQMALRMGDITGHAPVLTRRGDADAGGVLVVLRGRAGWSVLVQVRRPDGVAAWMRGTGADPVDEGAADLYVKRQIATDPDLWVIEFEAPDLMPPFEAQLV